MPEKDYPTSLPGAPLSTPAASRPAAAIAHIAARTAWLLLLCGTGASAATITTTVGGIDGELKLAALAGLDLNQYAGREVSAAQARRLYERAPAQIAAALEPYGYYDAKVSGDLKETPQGWTATINVTTGDPVSVTTLDLKLDGEARQLKSVRSALRAFEPKLGQPMNHAAYERGKAVIQAALFADGFLDAKLKTHRVEVSRSDHKAAISLAWEPGQRYRIGKTSYEGAQFPVEFLLRYQPWNEGDFYTQDQLLALQQRLNDADYFSIVDVNPDIENAADGVVPIKVTLAPAKRSIYTGGIFVGTDTGFGVRGGLDRRWMNRRGHKLKSEVIVAQRLKTASALYQIPLPGPDNRSLNYGINYRDENTKTTRSKITTLVASETRQWMGFTRNLGLHFQTGDFEIGDRKEVAFRGNSTILYPEAALTRKRADDPLFVRRGYSLSLLARAAAEGVLSDTNFVQLRGDVKWIRALQPRQRLILRGSVGTSWVDKFDVLPPDLRFFAGGDRSIRGYAYQTVGPERIVDPTKAPVVIGGKHLIAASAEYEYYFRSKWGIATFVDAGDAFSGTKFHPKIGTGIGLRWRSPVGMLRFDLGVPLREPKDGVQIHLVIGPDL
ncbi:autotransporter secretion outer membrane protein TamA [Tahibacter aquaticus]|uniref:Translocation and assembly module subunit TamA n=1 Tax=Tahibacter aquaticus TaxID=520092 RepID=A0A4R6YTK6_9GAMM|nr:autotransporter assembly complex family protein [Tahibacter aquaticus]TDR41678.1 autotransporter secretion outer membrane protein TamA [Tahibacter aquaticus]